MNKKERGDAGHRIRVRILSVMGLVGLMLIADSLWPYLFGTLVLVFLFIAWGVEARVMRDDDDNDINWG